MNNNTFKGMPLNEWMQMQWMPGAKGANKYKIGQDLTEAQAEEIKQIIAKSLGFEVDDPNSRKNLGYIGTPYRDFIVSYLLLMLETDDFDSDWAKALWNRLWFADQMACKKIMAERR